MKTDYKIIPNNFGYIAEYQDKKGRTHEIEESIDKNKEICEMKAKRFLRKNKVANIKYHITECFF